MTDIDRLIDAAANEIVAKQPSRNLRHGVMARIRDDSRPARRRIWLFAVPGAALACILAAIVLYPRTSPPIVEHMTLVQGRSVPHRLAPAPGLNVSPPLLIEAPVRVRNGVVRIPAAEPAVLAQPVQMIAVERIDIRPIDLLTTSISAIELANLTIEPLRASNN